ncbi:MAG: tetratricopeptide repeat protein [Chitinophagales bacterium]
MSTIDSSTMTRMPSSQNVSPAPLKMIFKGRLEFGAQRTFDMVTKHWSTRLETYFKSDILFKLEDIFLTDDFALSLPQPHTTVMGTEKAWRGTTDLFREIVQFAVVGKIQAWCISNGEVTEITLEPKTDKIAVSEYWLGCELVQKDGQMEEASAALSRAIDKYQRHALAYERRGYVNYKLQNYGDALYDFTKSIDVNPANPEPHYGRGKVRMLKGEWESAAQDFDAAVKRSIALQPIFWLARLKKCQCLVNLEQYAPCISDLQLFVKREFTAENPNFRRRRLAWYLLGRCYLATSDLKNALDAFNQALSIKEGVELLSDADLFLYRGRTLHATGASSFAKDLDAAAKLGSEEAAKLLKEWKK